MINKYNPHVREEGQPEALLRNDCTTVDTKNYDRGGRIEAAEGNPNALAKTGKKSINVVVDVDDPAQAQSLEDYRSAFGDDYVEVEPLEDGKVVLKLYPGGARGLL